MLTGPWSFPRSRRSRARFSGFPQLRIYAVFEILFQKYKVVDNFFLSAPIDAQYEACIAYIASQRYEGWKLVKQRFDDGGIF
jgi:hypothetical protein